MVRPLEAHIEIAKRLLAQECGSGGDAEEQAAAADEATTFLLGEYGDDEHLFGEPLRAYAGLLTGAPTYWETRNSSTDSRPGVR